jgi:eukaryotic-like serine/threonine-protein kinase
MDTQIKKVPPEQSGPAKGRFGPYEIVREIASGGTAMVWEARERNPDRKIALKVLHQHLALEPHFIQRFEQEARIAASLAHPNIVQVFNHGEADNHHFIAMEFIDGCSLEHLLTQKKNLPWHVIALIGDSACAALEYSHARSVIHRDVKPGNIMLSRNGVVKVTDFGFSRMVNSLRARLTMVNRVVGTPLFMAPEMIVGKEATFSSDIFSLGTVLYILACGRPPFAGDSMPAVMQKIMECAYVRPRKVDRAIPKKLEHIIVRCLQKNIDSRYSSMSEVMDDLKKLIQECPDESSLKELAAQVCDCNV